jgi:hypothetical protein
MKGFNIPWAGTTQAHVRCRALMIVRNKRKLLYLASSYRLNNSQAHLSRHRRVTQSMSKEAARKSARRSTPEILLYLATEH